MVVRNGHLHSWFCPLAAICFLVVHTWAADFTTCASSRLDWYTSVVGETPCTTYQKLRRICNNDYNVPALKTKTPGDMCDDQVSACCCNMIAFQLSMLCLNCQQDVLTGSGYDARTFILSFASNIPLTISIAPGTYTTYLGTFAEQSLPSDIQSSVCNEGIRLDDFLYGGWADGSCVWMSENAERTHAANNNQTFTHCAEPKSPTSTSIRTSTSTQTLPGASTDVKLNAPLGTTSNLNPAPTSITTPASPSTSSTMIPAGPLSLPPETTTQPSIQSSPSGLPDALQDVSAGPNTQTDTSSLVVSRS
ncbi:uncharacterized protein TRAVEDRAFT_121939 [Trametes versicolor FP-101664 SS1]|uniref:uncharacterized protein n=1 Tax=Trametes versicolor (strain FP-101664) TaxID=717944 RepID=UPI0004623FDB|nr:uncharacterized protein TRAVEDRAFT_121939 [Trametes versicolor FP-101664 SS1]EIW59543.1 hypothetical protein TRAVEDRAFT_121939 [Trametes versicolor FP-101664 SS1]